MDMVKDEQQLLTEIAGGNEQAFCLLVARYEHPLTIFIERHVDNRETAEEIVQDIFVKIWLTREGLVAIRNFRAYLFVIARNYAISCLRSHIRLRNRHTAWLTYTQENQENAGIDQHTRSTLDLIEQGIAALPEKQRCAWELARRQGLRYIDVATEMGISPETVKKYLQYATSSVVDYVKSRAAGLSGLSLIITFLHYFL